MDAHAQAQSRDATSGRADFPRGLGRHHDGSDLYRNRGASPPPPSYPPAPGNVAHTGERGFNLSPPEPGQHPPFDAKVAAEYFRLKAAKARSHEDGYEGEGRERTKESATAKRAQIHLPAKSVHNTSPTPEAFESDVEHAMRELEQDLSEGKGAPQAFDAATTFNPDEAATTRVLPPEPRRAGRAESVGSLLGGPGPLSSYPPPPDLVKQQQEATGILSQMDMHRAMPRAGKGKPGGLRDMWGGGGGMSDKRHFAAGSEAAPQRRRKGGGLAGMWQGDEPPEIFQNAVGTDNSSGTRDGVASYSQGQGSGLRGMWDGEGGVASSPAQPSQRKGPGLRGLWSGAHEMATADAEKSESKAAYLRALDHDVQQRRIAVMSSGDGEQQNQRIRQESWEPGVTYRTRPGNSFYNDATVENAVTSSTGIGGVPGLLGSRPSSAGAGTPRQRRETSEEERWRIEDKAKKAAYAEELRQQIAEKEARKNAEKHGQRGGRHRSTGGGIYSGTMDDSGGFGALHEGERRGPAQDPMFAESLHAGSNGVVPFERRREGLCRESPPSSMGRAEKVSPTQRSSFAPNDTTGGNAALIFPYSSTSGSSPANDEPRRVTAARRRLVADVYGGDGMGAALGGSRYRRSSTGSMSANGFTVVTNGSALVQGGKESEIGACHAEIGAATSRHLQNLHGDCDLEDRWQRRAAALEQQSALQEQIASKAKAKKEEEKRRQRENEEEFRQQQEHARSLKMAAEEQRRRKQAEQQEQLRNLYRQQEEALRKRRPGGGVGGVAGGENAQRSSISEIVKDNQDANARAPANDGAVPYQGQASTLADAAVVALHQTPRRSPATDIDDLPAGAQARAEVLRKSPGGDVVSAPSPSRKPPSRSGSYRADRFSPGGAIPGALPLPVPRFDSDGARLAFDDGHSTGNVTNGTADIPLNGRRIRAIDTDKRGGRGGPGWSELTRAERGSVTESKLGEPQLRTHSTLLPVSSESLFPAGDVAASQNTLLDRSGVESMLRDSETLMGWSDRMEPGKMNDKGKGSRHSMLFPSIGERPEIGRDTAAATAATPHGAAALPQDEMDALVTSWQTKHLQRRHSKLGLADEREQEGQFAFPISPRPTPSISPSRTLRNSRTRTSTGGLGGGWGAPAELEESLAATSRLIDLPRKLPLSPKAAVGAASGASTASRDRRPRSEMLTHGSDAVGHGAEVCDRSLTSDSVLYYLTGQQQEDTAPKGGYAGGSDRRSALEGMVSGLQAKSAVAARDARDAGGGNVASEPVPQSRETAATEAAALQEIVVASAGRINSDEEPMSPLTRLLAATDVRLGSAAGGRGFASRSDADVPWGERSRHLLNNIGHDRLEAAPLPLSNKGRNAGRNDDLQVTVAPSHGRIIDSPPLRQSAETIPKAPSAAVTDDPHCDTGSSGRRGGRRIRPLWGAAPTGGAAIPEGLIQRDDGMPWKDLSEVRGSFSSSVNLVP